MEEDKEMPYELNYAGQIISSPIAAFHPFLGVVDLQQQQWAQGRGENHQKVLTLGMIQDIQKGSES